MKSTKILSFRVAGVAQPRGSKKPITVPGKRGFLIDANRKSGPWMDVVKHAAREAMKAAGLTAPLNEPLSMKVVIYRARPKGHYGKRGLLSSAPRFPATKPDCSKYLRAIEDAMTGVVYVDDGRLIDSWPSKRWGEAGVLIEIFRPEGE